MVNIPQIFTYQFTYLLPEERIAKYPLEERDESKLLVYQKGISQSIFKNIADYLPSNTLLVNNNSKVIPARLQFHKPTGGLIEIFCLEPLNTSVEDAMQATMQCQWKCYVGGAAKWNSGTIVQWHIPNQFSKAETIDATLVSKESDCYIIQFNWCTQTTFENILLSIGNIPIPPYLKRKAEASDNETYQTVYAAVKGSVAAPTAGLHFTNNVLESLKQKNIPITSVTLHVGAGTFKPITSETINEHSMHAEWVQISKSTIALIASQLLIGKVASVGTTSVRSLESLYWWALICYNNKAIQPDEITVNQWAPYENNTQLNAVELMQWLLAQMESQQLQQISFKTQVMIVPGYPFKIVDILITNFHQPNSTLLLLISAFTNDNWLPIYDYALANDFRFLSYGDSSILFR